MAPTQDALYEAIDLDLSWSEGELPQHRRTRHVHGLHPYLGKFVPQLVETLLARHLPHGGRVLDPFAGSGTTLVQALESGLDATGADIAAFNCLLMRVKTRRYDVAELEHELLDAYARWEGGDGDAGPKPAYVREWFAPMAGEELLRFRSLVGEYAHADVLRVVLARAARSARLTTHFDLDFPRVPQLDRYWCHKHRRECRPVERAGQFLRRYTYDTLARIAAFDATRDRGRVADVRHGDARTLGFGGCFDAVVTSPPYPGLIDYHGQHRYAYELLGLDDLGAAEIGSPAGGTSRAALGRYVDDVAGVLANARDHLRDGAPVVVVIGDRRDLYPELLQRAGLTLVERRRRHVNRRTGRRAGEFFEDVLVARAA